MSDTPKGNGKPSDSKRNGKGQFVKGSKPVAGWKPGQSGNPAGYRSLGSLLTAALRKEMTNEDGTLTTEIMELFAEKIVKWAQEESPKAAYTHRQNVAIKALLERFDPVALQIKHEHSGKVAVGLTPAATAFQEACGEFAHENKRAPTIGELREIRNHMQVTDADLGINGNGE